MFKNKQLVLLLVFLLALALIIGAACTPQQRPTPTPRNTEDLGNGDTRMDEDGDTRLGENNENNRNVPNNNAAERASQLAEKIADSIESVNSATVVFVDRVVYVGIDLKADLSGEEADSVKEEIAELVKDEEPDVERVYVTQDADTYSRLRDIADDIEEGRPISGFLDELENMFRRVTPSMD